ADECGHGIPLRIGVRRERRCCCSTTAAPRSKTGLAEGRCGSVNFPSQDSVRIVCGRPSMSFTAQHLYFQDVEVGQQWESLGRTITETDIVNFAGLSGDFNPIHIDHEFAKTTPFRRPIAHGLLVFSIASGLGLFAPPMRTLAIVAIKDWQFKGPIFVGDTI